MTLGVVWKGYIKCRVYHICATHVKCKLHSVYMPFRECLKVVSWSPPQFALRVLL